LPFKCNLQRYTVDATVEAALVEFVVTATERRVAEAVIATIVAGNQPIAGQPIAGFEDAALLNALLSAGGAVQPR
jgi:hypothetical protein